MANLSLNVGPGSLILGGTSLGLTHGGIQLVITRATFDSKADVTGENARQRYVLGEEVKVTAKITEATLTQLAALTGGSLTEGSTEDQTVIKSLVGTLLANQELIIKPLEAGVLSTDESEWIHIPSASLNFNIDLPITIDAQRVWGFECMGHPVVASEIAAAGHLYNSGSPEYAVGDLVKLGKSN